MLESGIVSLKNEVNIMMKNVVDVVLGGVTYWAFGYGLSYGSGKGTGFCRSLPDINGPDPRKRPKGGVDFVTFII